MIILLKLLLAHLIGDFILQPNSWIDCKRRLGLRCTRLYGHMVLHGVLVWIFLWSWSAWGVALMIAATHGLIDITKISFEDTSNRTKWFLIDQFLHIMSLIGIWWIDQKPTFSIADYLSDEKLWLYMTAIVFLTAASQYLVSALIRPWSRQIKTNADSALQNAGQYIGILERLFVFVFVITGHWEGVGFLLGAKSVFRFGDLREAHDRKLTEYILIGTMISFGIALATALWVQYIANFI